MNIVKHEKAVFEKNGLIIHDSITIDEWKDLGVSLKKVEGCVQFWIGDWARYGEKRGFTGKYTDSKVYDELELVTGLQRDTIQKYKSVSDRVESGTRIPDLSFNHHREVASLPPEKQHEYLNEASEKKMSVRDLRELVRKNSVTVTKQPEPLKKTYEIIYADPPWKYGNSMPAYFSEQANHYPLMTIQEICEMPIKGITAQNAALFLWVTSPILEESFEVVNSWGFEYKTSFIWDKIKHNMGHYSSVRHEILLLCIKGSYPLQIKKLFDSVYSEERTEHSKKPDFYYDMIEAIYPNGDKIELFARQQRNGWDNYGNQI